MATLQRYWLALTAGGCALVTAFYLYLWRTAALPLDGQPINYPFTLAYNYSALPVSIVVVLAALTALFFWFPQALVRAPGYRRDGALVGLALASAVLSILLAAPLGRLIYRELNAVSANGRTYHLGVRVSADPQQNAYVLCVDAAAAGTDCRYLYDESLTALKPLPELKVDAAGQVSVWVGERRLYATP